jgi:hypothetical protein
VTEPSVSVAEAVTVIFAEVENELFVRGEVIIAVGAVLIQLLLTCWLEILDALPPATVCNGLLEGMVYETVTTSPATIRFTKVSLTFAPETETEFTVLATEFTKTINDEMEGTILARAISYVISTKEGVVFATTEF